MSSCKITWSSNAWEDYSAFVRDDPKTAKRIVRIINDILKSPYEGIGKPEQLRYQLQGYWSRRVTDEHRLVYRATDGETFIATARYHYG